MGTHSPAVSSIRTEQHGVMALSEERTGEEDEEQLVMRRLRNSVDDLRRGLRHLTYKMEKVKVKAEKSREHREKIELLQGTISLAGEPTPFRAYVPQGEIIKYGQDGSKAPRLMYKGVKLNNRSLHNFRPIIGGYIATFGISYATKIA